MITQHPPRRTAPPAPTLRVETLRRAQWVESLRQLPSHAYFVSPGFIDVWIEHHAPQARARALRVVAADGAWRIAAFVETASSRFGTRAYTGAPDGGYGTAGTGTMPDGWAESLVDALAGPLTDSVELTLEPDAIGASPSDAEAPMQTWIVDISRGYEHWHDQQIDKAVRRQLRIAEQRGVRTTTSDDPRDVDAFIALYARAVGDEPAGRPRHPEAFLRGLLQGRGPGEAKLCLTKVGATTIAGGIQLRGGTAALAWIGCYDRDFADHHPNVHRHATAIRDLCAIGASQYNLGAAPGLPNVAQFKRKLGAAPAPYCTLRWENEMLRTLRRIVRRS